MANGFNMMIGSKVDTAQLNTAIGTITKSVQTAINNATAGKLTKTVSTYVKNIANADGTTTKYIKTLTSYTNAQGQSVDATGKAVKQGAAFLTNQKSQITSTNKATQTIKTNTTAVEKNATAVQNGSNAMSKFVTTISRVAYVKLAADALSLFTTACNEAKEAIFEYNSAMTELKKVTSFTDEEYQLLADDLDTIAEKVARTRTELVDAVTEFAKSGNYTTAQLENLAEVATMYQNIADSELSAGDAASYIISQMKAYGIAAEDAITIIDKTNEVSNNFAVSSTDISTALTKGASALAGYGNSIDEVIGLVTAGAEIMTSQSSKVVKGLRTIGANILNASKSADTLEISVNGVTKSIDLLDSTTGDMRSTYDVLSDIATEWDNMTNSEKSTLALSLSGKTQIDVFTSILSNFNSAIQATATSLDSAGSAEAENSKYLESLNARVSALKQSFTTLVLGDGGLEQFAKILISTATAIIDFINAIGGLNTILVTLGAVGLIAVIYNAEKLSKAITNLLSIFTNLGQYITRTVNNYLNTTIDDMVMLATEEQVAAASTAMLQLSLSALVGVISLAVILWLNYKQAQEEAMQAAVSTASAYTEESEALKESISLAKLESVTRSDLVDIIKNKLGDAYDAEKESLKDINELRAEAIDLLYQEARANAQETVRELGSKAQKAEEYLTTEDDYGVRVNGGITGITASFDAYGTPEEIYEAIGNKLDELNAKRETENGLLESEQFLYDILLDDYKKYKEEIENNTEINNAYQDSLNVLNSTEEEYINGIKEAAHTTEEYVDVLSELGYSTYEELEEALTNAGGSIDEFDSLLEQDANSALVYAKAILSASTDLSEVVSNLSDSLDEVSSAYDALSSAVEEYNENGALSVDTLTSLLENYPQYIQYLYDENGKINLNSDALQTLAEARKADALQQIAQAEAADLQAYAEGNLNEVSELGQSILTAYQSVIEGVGDKAQDASGDILELATYVNTLNNTISGGNSSVSLSGLEALKNGWDSIRKSIADTDTTVNKYSSSSSSAASSSSDAWKEAFEKEKDALDHLLAMEEISEEEYYKRLSELNEKYFGEASGMHEKYLEEYQENEEAIYKGLVSAYKDKVEEEKDAALDAIDDVIDALEKEKDAALDAIDDQIDALKKAQEDALDAIDAEIKALEKAQEAQHDYYQEKIDALEKAHDLQEQINQLEEYENQLAQAKATKVWVMKDGQFQLAEDESSVSTAEQQLSNYKDEMDYEQQLQELQDLQDYWDEYYDNLIEQKEEYRDYIEEYYESQIEALEEYRDQVEEQYEAEIEALEEQKEALEEYYDEMLENYKSHVDSMMEEWSSFISESDSKYSESLAGLSEYVSSWNSLVSSMATPTVSGGGAYNEVSHTASVSLMSSGNASIGAYASGYGSAVKDSEIALVGESPNTEMLIGSKINTGVVTRLQKGSGVVNAESTKTLAGILNSLGKNSYVGGENGNTTTQNFSFGSISLPNVTDGNSFVEALKNTFSSYTIQYANAKA